ncbi:hypothetical protein [Klebsiella pneumoniae]|uniref:hypothetical protein n=1 Tax=Klebsiella pneumoniae TaxID=573 RepID=UPI002B49760D|nr:hypothetical protein [Klebsiella pneumoniae]MEB2971874.1 hypothetical protein [Klebsiella pneumoniae]
MNIETVNELITSLESAGELSIKETKVMALAKAYQQLAAENVEAKKIISECREYFIAGVMNRIRPTNEGYLHMICDTFADETPATARIVAGIKVDAQSEVIEWLDAEITAIDTMYRGDPSYERDANWMKSEVLDVVELARKAFPAQLREGADK